MYAHRRDAPRHREYRAWLENEVNSERPFGLSELVLSGFVRVVTHPRIYARPSPLRDALEVCERLRTHPRATTIAPGARHWEIFARLCAEHDTRGSLVADAHHAALAIESESEWITTDRDYRRFTGLRVRHPLDG